MPRTKRSICTPAATPVEASDHVGVDQGLSLATMPLGARARVLGLARDQPQHGFVQSSGETISRFQRAGAL